MTDGPTVDDLQRENDELRQRNGELLDGLRGVVRRQAATEAGLDPEMARWVKGDTVEEAVADAQRLAASTGATAPTPPPPSPEADALQQHMKEGHDDAAALHPDPTDQED